MPQKGSSGAAAHWKGTTRGSAILGTGVVQPPVQQVSYAALVAFGELPVQLGEERNTQARVAQTAEQRTRKDARVVGRDGGGQPELAVLERLTARIGPTKQQMAPVVDQKVDQRSGVVSEGAGPTLE